MSRERFKSLRRRLLVRLLCLVLLCSAIAIPLQAWWVYQKEQARFQEYVAEIGRVHLPLLSLGLWDFEVDALTQQIEQIALRKNIERVVLLSETGLNIASDDDLETYPTDAVLPIYALKAPHDKLGELRIEGNHDQARAAALMAIGQRLFEIAVFASVIGLLIAFWLYRELDRPLRRLANYLAGLTPETPTPPPALRPPGRDWFDEMDMVERGFEALHGGLLRYSAERDAAITALEGERDLLDIRVSERTRSLQRVADYQAIISQTLMSCLHLSASGFPVALQNGLERLQLYVGAESCGLARFDGKQWVWRFAFGPRWQAGQPLLLSKPSTGWSLLPDDSGQSWIYVRSGDGDDGQLFACNLGQGELTAEHRVNLQMAAESLFGLIEHWTAAEALEQTRAELERLSLSDPLTALANRRRFEQIKLQEGRRARRHAQPLSVLMVDIDHFKAYNDHYRHADGDECLVRVAACLSDLFQRAGEVPARLGGEEFAVVLPGYDERTAQQAAERVRQAIFDLRLPHQASNSGTVSVSIGYASWAPEQGELDLNALLAKADEALYRAKAQGRNRVEAAL